MAMLSIHSECLLYDLRSVLSAVRDHNTTLCVHPELVSAERRLTLMIERIEDAASFIQALEAIVAASEGGLGSDGGSR